MRLVDRVRATLKRQARQLDKLAERVPGGPAERLAAYRADPSRLMLDAGFTPDPWQAEFLRSSDRFNLMLCARQVGKSLAVSLLALHTVLTTADMTTVVIAQRQDQAAELLRKAVGPAAIVNAQIRRKRYTESLRNNVQQSIEFAVTDALTGLHNRRYLLMHLKTLLEAVSPEPDDQIEHQHRNGEAAKQHLIVI